LLDLLNQNVIQEVTKMKKSEKSISISKLSC